MSCASMEHANSSIIWPYFIYSVNAFQNLCNEENFIYIFKTSIHGITEKLINAFGV